MFFVRYLSCVPLFAAPWIVAMPGSSVLHYLPEFAQVHVHWISDAILTISCSANPFIVQSFPVSGSFHLGGFCIRWPKYWSFSFGSSPSDEYLGLISFRIDWFDLLAVKGTLKHLLQHHNSKASILRYSVFLWSNSHIHDYWKNLLEK